MGATRLILVVEDNDLTREVLATLLNQEGYRVVLAGNGEEALNHLLGGLRPDLILLDMLMPVLDGWHFLERLRSLRLQPPLPIVITTATNLTREWAEPHGCQGFLRKPIETDRLLEEVRRCLRLHVRRTNAGGFGELAEFQALAPADVLANDSDCLTATLVRGPKHGTLIFHADGSFTYWPKRNFSGTDHFTYKASDSNTATVTITVTPAPGQR